MNKHLPPPLKMKVERGRLVPATQYDSERLDSYRVGSTVNVRFTADRIRPLERKYRAILGKVVKDCDTPWSNAEAAHQAIKLACGIVNVGKTAGGQFMQWPRSLVDLDDKEMEEFFEDAMSLLHRLTGVDIETMKRESVQVPDEDAHDPETGEIIDNSVTGPNISSDAPVDDAAACLASSRPEEASQNLPSSGQQIEAENGNESAPEESAAKTSPQANVPADSSSLFAVKFADRELMHLKDFARKALDDAAGPNDMPAKEVAIERMRLNYLDAVETKGAKAAIEAMSKPLSVVIAGNRTRAQAANYIATELLGCSASDLEGRR